jgi:hypothetical protein
MRIRGADIGRASVNSTYVPSLTRYVHVALVVDLTALTMLPRERTPTLSLLIRKRKAKVKPPLNLAGSRHPWELYRAGAP